MAASFQRGLAARHRIRTRRRGGRSGGGGLLIPLFLGGKALSLRAIMLGLIAVALVLGACARVPSPETNQAKNKPSPDTVAPVESISLPAFGLDGVVSVDLTSFDPGKQPVRLKMPDDAGQIKPLVAAINRLNQVTTRDKATTPDFSVEIRMASGDNLKLHYLPDTRSGFGSEGVMANWNGAAIFIESSDLYWAVRELGQLLDRPEVALPALTVPTPVNTTEGQAQEIRPVDLRVSPDGKYFALWYAIQGDGLLVWKAGESSALKLSGVALRELVWAPNGGLYFAHMTGPMTGKAQIMRYRWGAAKPEVVLDSHQLHASPKLLVFDARAGRLIFSEAGGLKAVTPGGGTTESIEGPGLPETVSGGSFDPIHYRYVTTQNGKLVLAVPGQTVAMPLGIVGDQSLYRVTWSPDGETVAAELGSYQGETHQIVLYSVPPSKETREIGRVEGTQPVLFPDQMFYLLPNHSAVMRVKLPWGNPGVSVTYHISYLAGDQIAGRLYLMRPGEIKDRLPYIEVR